MEGTFSRILENLVSRVQGPMHFRIVLQPAVAIVYAVVDGRKDARDGRVPYFWSLFTEPTHRYAQLRSGWQSVGKVFIVAVVLDAVFQIWQLHWFYPGEAFLVATFLAILPYVLLRGPINRFTAHKKWETPADRRH